MRLSALSIGVICLMVLQAALVSDATAQGKKKRGSKKNGGHVAEPQAEQPSTEGEAEEGGGVSEEEASAQQDEDGKSKSINERLKEDESGGLRRSGRMEFDERLIKGQAAKSGAVYLFKRIPRHLPGLVPMRRSYRSRIVEPILGAVPLKPAKYSYELSEKDKEALRAEAEKAAAEAATAEAAAATPTESTPEAKPEGETGTDDAPEDLPAPKKKRRK